MIKAALYLILLLGLAAWAFVSRDWRRYGQTCACSIPPAGS